MTEQVLVLPLSAVPDGSEFVGVRWLDDGDLARLKTMIRRAGRWLDRVVAEEDPDYKQVIPYVVVRDREQVFLMERTTAGGDERLHRMATIGVGGHVNPKDDGADPLDAGLRREWHEELAAEWEPVFVPIGLLNDDRNPVGSVHLGVVFTVEAGGRPLRVRERDKLSGAMATVDELHAGWDRLETWSQLVAEALWGPPPAPGPR